MAGGASAAAGGVMASFDDAMLALIIGIVTQFQTLWGRDPTVAEVREAMQKQ